MFGVKDGFDIVIGNPPYIKEYTNKSAFESFKKSIYYQGKMDLWYAFGCVMIDNLKPNGIQCFIAQNNWITSAGASKLRKKILDETKIISFVDFGNYKVFASAGIQTMIYLIQKAKVNIGESYTIKYSLLNDENLNNENLSEFLNFDFKADFAQKYLFDITTSDKNDKAFNFNTNDAELILNKIAMVANYKFTEKEIAQGIVPNPDVVNNRNIEKIPLEKVKEYEIKLGDGVFIVKKGRFDNLEKVEKKYIKPIFEPNEVSRYKFVNDYESEILYITKTNYKKDAPNLIQHLEKYKEIMDERRKNQNGRLDFFHLHWPRDEYYFAEGPKILSIRKCDKPTFIYTDQPTYVMMSFNIIRTHSKSHKYLTALLNSRLIEYWLKNKGKMQGNNYQIDKEPLLNIPLFIPKSVTNFETLVDYLLYLYNKSTPQILSHTDNTCIAKHIEDILNMMVYELYFEEHMKEVGIDVLQFINPPSIGLSFSPTQIK
ncbi:MAG: Eco57I restriction-modification methylase domain-containing protein, partial [Sediminibacterium sp.]|nr:Eco57I restriction-modification methylase domain-containing protein [Sediminibacterium sp.]